MSESLPYRPRALADLVGEALEPVGEKRGLPAAALVALWGEIAGRFADVSRPEKITWPRGSGGLAHGATLQVRVDPAHAFAFQYETGAILSRLNAALGFGGVGKIRVIQAPVLGTERPVPPTPNTDPVRRAELEQRLCGIADERLRALFIELGMGVKD